MVDRLKLFFNPQPGTGDADTRAPWRIFWVALAVRLAYMTLAHT